MRLLFVCAGNIMRSVMAECILRARSDEMLAGAAGALTSESCGIAVEREMPPHPEALRALEKLGIPVCETNASMADSEQMARADLALTMTRQQCYKLASRFLDDAPKCYSLVEVNGAIEMLLEDRGLELDGADWAWEARALGADELARALQAAAAEIKAIPRDKVRQIPGVDIADRMQAEKGAPLTEFEAAVLAERIAAARAWLESYAPDRARLAVRRDAVPEEVTALDEAQHSYLAALAEAAADEKPVSGDAWQTLIFRLATETELGAGRAFGALYAAFLGRRRYLEIR